MLHNSIATSLIFKTHKLFAALNKKELDDKITEAQNTLQTAIDKVASDLEKAITELNAAIDKKADTATVIGSTALVSNIALIAYVLIIKKKKSF